MPTSTSLSAADATDAARVSATYAELRTELAKRIVGLDDVIEELLIAVFTGGHVLLIGVPGLAKTLLISSLAECLDLSFRRVQFTPDLMPSDIVGTEVLVQDTDSGERSFQFHRGPIFANVVLADEINRTPPKTQAALMEAMEEKQVTSVGEVYGLDAPFFVLATQNPIEQEGTDPLPAAQMDRFLFSIDVDYPDEAEEARIVRLTTSRKAPELRKFLDRDSVIALQAAVRRQAASEEVMKYALAIVRATRSGRPEAAEVSTEWLEWGAGPRAAQALVLGGKARALLHGRTEVLAEDVRALIGPVLGHRLIANYQSEAEGVTVEKILERITREVPAPDGWEPPPASSDEPRGWFGRWFRRD